eukprot:TCALIF_13656-PA protein Name:"Similar to K02A2.6 Uncharacterized protein K02A2.6 (Caenorhabditis elegans)" AED:0.35 eAED:0.35 QI:4/0/0/1/0/0/3/0/326
MVKSLCDVLERCARHGLTVRKEKLVLAATTIRFVGYRISHGSIEADPSKLHAISEFPVPTTKTEIRLKVKWRKEKEQQIPDALSRTPATDPDEQQDPKEDKDGLQINTILEISSAADDLISDDVHKRAKDDLDYQELNHFSIVPNGYVEQFQKLFHELSVENDLFLRGHRIVIPRNSIKVVLQRLHASHQGLEKTKRRVRQTVYWPGFDNDMVTTVEACESCQTYRPSHVSEHMMQEALPTQAFDVVTSDLFLLGSHHYLVYADRRVLVQDPTSLRWDTLANVVGTEDNRRYRLRFPSDRALWRNRKFLRLLKQCDGDDSSDEEYL